MDNIRNGILLQSIFDETNLNIIKDLILKNILNIFLDDENNYIIFRLIWDFIKTYCNHHHLNDLIKNAFE